MFMAFFNFLMQFFCVPTNGWIRIQQFGPGRIVTLPHVERSPLPLVLPQLVHAHLPTLVRRREDLLTELEFESGIPQELEPRGRHAALLPLAIRVVVRPLIENPQSESAVRHRDVRVVAILLVSQELVVRLVPLPLAFRMNPSVYL